MLGSRWPDAPRPRRRSKLGPVGWFLLLMLGGYALVTALFYWLMTAQGEMFPLLFVVFIAYDFVIYLVYFWIGVYFVVELQLWRHTRNEGHLLQFLGALLVLAPISWGLITSGTSNLYGMFSPAGLALILLEFVSLAVGTGMALYGYYHPPFRANDVDLYRNVVVRSGERIGLLTDGYSTRVYETRYEGFPGDAVRARADEYATRFQRAGFLLFHRTDATGVTLYPITYTGVGGFRLITAFVHLYRLWRKPDRLTWVRLDWTGDVQVHISPEDYERIKRPVAYHALCAGVADAVVGSLLAYVDGREAAAVQGLLVAEPARRRTDLRLPPTKPGREAWMAIGVAIVILVAGVGLAVGVDFVSVTQPRFSIEGVYWQPAHPVGGQNINLFANLTGLEPFSGPLQNFGVTIWAYYNDSLFGARYLAQISGDLYGTRLGAFPNGTEVTFLLLASQSSGSGTVFAASPAYVLRVGTVRTGGSQLTVEAPTARLGSLGDAVFGAWINSTLPLDTMEVLYSGYYTYSGDQGSGSGGIGIAGVNLTGPGPHYTVGVPLFPYGYLSGQHAHIVIWYKIVARDTHWNTASSPLLTYEVDL